MPLSLSLTIVAIHLDRVVGGIVAIRSAVSYGVDHKKASGCGHLKAFEWNMMKSSRSTYIIRSQQLIHIIREPPLTAATIIASNIWAGRAVIYRILGTKLRDYQKILTSPEDCELVVDVVEEGTENPSQTTN